MEPQQVDGTTTSRWNHNKLMEPQQGDGINHNKLELSHTALFDHKASLTVANCALFAGCDNRQATL